MMRENMGGGLPISGFYKVRYNYIEKGQIPVLLKLGTDTRDGTIVRTGEQVLLGGNDTYVSLCRKHLKEGRVNG